MTRARITSQLKASRRLRMGWYTIFALIAVVLASRTWAQQPPQDVNENFDIRLDTNAASVSSRQRLVASPSSADVAGMASTRAAGLARLRGDFAGIDVAASPELGTPEVVSVRPGSRFLMGRSGDRVGAMRTFLSTYADAYGLSN